MPCPLKAVEPQRGYTSKLLAGSKPHLQSSYTLWSTALPRADARSTRPELGRTATGPRAQTTASETVSTRGIKEANIISKYQKCTG